MFSRVLHRASRSPICTSCLRQFSTTRFFPEDFLQPKSSPAPRPSLSISRLDIRTPLNQLQQRNYSEKSAADELIEEIQDQYGTARDEFEIATEETEKKSVYAADDRAAAREELDRLKEMYEKAVEGGSGEEVKMRVGQRIRELDQAVQALERSALEE